MTPGAGADCAFLDAVVLAVVAFTVGALPAVAGAPTTAEVSDDICLVAGCTDCSCGEEDLVFVLAADVLDSVAAVLAPHLQNNEKDKGQVNMFSEIHFHTSFTHR